MSKHGISTDANTWIGNTFIYEGTLAISVSAMAISLLGFGRAFLSSWPLVWLGRISYSIYLIHLTTFRFIPRHRTIGTATVAAAASIGYALLMWCVVEKHLLTKPESDHSSTATSETQRFREQAARA
jgi:peptidoglycan/LPS O-acetylase OafA/YrhL